MLARAPGTAVFAFEVFVQVSDEKLISPLELNDKSESLPQRFQRVVNERKAREQRNHEGINRRMHK